MYTCGGNETVSENPEQVLEDFLWLGVRGGANNIPEKKEKQKTMGRKEAVLLCLKLECNHSVLPIKLGFALPHSPVKPAGQRGEGGGLFFPHTFLPSQTKRSWIWRHKSLTTEVEKGQSENTPKSKPRALPRGTGY